jgi:hypothetical protein
MQATMLILLYKDSDKCDCGLPVEQAQLRTACWIAIAACPELQVFRAVLNRYKISI